LNSEKKSSSTDITDKKLKALPVPGKKPVGRPKLYLTAEEELERKKKRYTPKEVK